MAFTVGVNTDAYLNGVDLTPYLSGSDAGATADAIDVTPYGATADMKQYIPGLQQTTINVSGFFDPSAGANELTLRAVLGTVATWTLLPAGDAAGNRGQAVAGFETDFRQSSPVAGAVSITATSQGTVPAEGVVVLAAKQQTGFAGAGTTNVASVDFGTAMNGGTVSTGALASYIHVFAGSGAGTVTVNVQHATTSGGAYSTILSHTAFVASTAPTYERKLLAAGTTINEFLRTQVVFSGAGTVTLHNSVARYS